MAYRTLGKSQNQTSGPKISPRRSRQESKVQRIRQRARQAGTDDIVPGNRLQNKFFCCNLIEFLCHFYTDMTIK